MKTKINIRLIAIAITLAAVATSFNAEAQRKEYKKNDSAKQEKVHKYNSRKANVDRKHDSRRADVNRRYDDWKTYQYDRNQTARRYNVRDRHQHHGDYFYYNKNRNEYNHPQYGHVYRKFNSNPLKLRHTHGDLYFYGGNYYRQYPGVGYVRVAIPRGVVFVDLPSRCERIRVGHNYYYRYGDMVFERCDHGYRLAPTFDIHLSARF